MTIAERSITTQQRSRAFWLKHLHRWHWISAATCLIGMLLFSITGFTLNHANWVTAKPVVTTRTAQLPESLLAELR
ncbi:MAG TPA: PepSY-associated TM helix domain-containing protein, partial [Steroidobacteraceae bacterium]